MSAHRAKLSTAEFAESAETTTTTDYTDYTDFTGLEGSWLVARRLTAGVSDRARSAGRKQANGFTAACDPSTLHDPLPARSAGRPARYVCRSMFSPCVSHWFSAPFLRGEIFSVRSGLSVVTAEATQSARSALMTSTRDARAAGISEASTAAARRTIAAPARASAPGIRTSGT